MLFCRLFFEKMGKGMLEFVSYAGWCRRSDGQTWKRRGGNGKKEEERRGKKREKKRII